MTSSLNSPAGWRLIDLHDDPNRRREVRGYIQSRNKLSYNVRIRGRGLLEHDLVSSRV